ncbi:MAG: DUF3105 domain-containing protein [Nocardioides sp.]|uniref:hypothetical protein n=1 Tax=Nocardioides sp. TaxID=35761 RepID=UPI0039E4A4EE
MAKKSAKSDRRAVVDQIRKKQRGAERARGMAIIGVCVVIALAIVGVAAAKPVMSSIRLAEYGGKTLSEIGDSASAAGCQKAITLTTSTKKLATNGTYYLTAPLAFASSYSAISSGTAASMSTKFYTATTRPDLTTLLRNLSEGFTILWYDNTVSDTELDQIRAIAKKFPGTTNYRYKFIAAPWKSADEKTTKNKKKAHTVFPEGTHIAFSHWTGTDDSSTSSYTTTSVQKGIIQYCSSVSGAALKTFMEKHPYTDSPDPTTAS